MPYPGQSKGNRSASIPAKTLGRLAQRVLRQLTDFPQVGCRRSACEIHTLLIASKTRIAWMAVSGQEKMTTENRFKGRYEAHDTPWDIGAPDFNLILAVTNTPIKPCKAVDIGCGTGDNAIWLAQQGFDAVGIDTSEVAIAKAEEKASKAKSNCRFFVGNFLTGHIEGAPFGFIFDRGLFHVFETDEERKKLAENVHRHLGEAGLWLSLIGNADEQRNTPGPPQRRAGDIVNAVERYFEILSLVAGHFGANRPDPPRAWVCAMRKRQIPG
jgi:SAM-dependent methyltransferase